MAVKKNRRPKSSRIHSRWKRSWAVGVISLAILFSLAGLAVAKYMRSTHSGVPVRAKEFYFTSSLLDGKTHTLAPGSTSLEFTLGNHGDDLRYSEVDINYVVEVKKEGKVDGTVSVTGKPEKLEKGGVRDATVTISNLQAGIYTITAIGTGGYTKTLETTIVIPKVEAKIYQYLDESAGEYALLTVWNEGDEEGNVKITYTGIPDNTNPNMSGWESSTGDASVETESIAIGPHESKVFRFFDGVATASNAERQDLTRKRSVRK